MERTNVSVSSVAAIGRRKTREDWIVAARRMLVRSGVDNVKVDRLASDLRTTRGSFYWHFKHREALLEALLQDWEVINYVSIAKIRARWARSTPDLSELIEFWISEGSESPAFGMAIRTWARTDENVEEVMHRVDNQWIDLLQLLFPLEVYDESERLVRARVVYFHQVGYHALGLRENQAERVRLVPYYYKVLSGHEPGEHLCDLMRPFESDEPVPSDKPSSAEKNSSPRRSLKSGTKSSSKTRKKG